MTTLQKIAGAISVALYALAVSFSVWIAWHTIGIVDSSVQEAAAMLMVLAVLVSTWVLAHALQLAANLHANWRRAS